MKTLFDCFFKKENLWLRILPGFLLGILFGILFPGFSIAFKVAGDMYLNLLKMMIIPVVACSVYCGIANIRDGALLRSIGLRTVLLYVLMFLVSSAVSLGIVYALRPGLALRPAEAPVYAGTVDVPTVSSFLLTVFPSNIIQAAANGSTLPVILFAGALAVAAVSLGEGSALTRGMNALFAALQKLLGWIMELTPLGVFSLMAFAVAEYGAAIFGSLAGYISTCWLCCIAVFFAVMIFPCCLLTGIKPGRLLKGCGRVALMTLSTTSSAATLPTTLKVSTEDLGAPEDISGFTLPLGCTINMCGGACSFCCLAVFTADFFGVHLSFGTVVYLVLLATLLNMAAPGIPGGGVVLGASFLSMIGLPVDLMGPIAGVYRLLDMAFTTINVEGDITANLIIAKQEENRAARKKASS